MKGHYHDDDRPGRGPGNCQRAVAARAGGPESTGLRVGSTLTLCRLDECIRGRSSRVLCKGIQPEHYESAERRGWDTRRTRGPPVAREDYLAWECDWNKALAEHAPDGLLNEFMTSGDELLDTLERVAAADLELPAWHQSWTYTVGTLVYWRIYELGFHGWDVRATLDRDAAIPAELCPYVLRTLRQLQAWLSTPAPTIEATCRFEVDGQSWITRVRDGKVAEISDSSAVDAVIRRDASTHLLLSTLRQSLTDSADRIMIEGSRAPRTGC
jgi:hypothetical protein